MWEGADLRHSGGLEAGLEAVVALLRATAGPAARPCCAPPPPPARWRGRLEVTPSAVSQHLAVLHRSGLVRPAAQRAGSVLYQASELGLALLRR